MIKIRNYFKSLFIIILVLCAVWFVSIQLTQQRIVLEAENNLNAIKSGQSPFVWDFSNFKMDVVESFQHYWQTENAQSIYASKDSNPHLSLNFSGQSINTLLHDKLLINFAKPVHGIVKIQIKSHLADDAFYYSSPLNISEKNFKIDLNQLFTGYKASGESVGTLKWGKELTTMSSLVLIFENPKDSIEINKITLPYSQQKLPISKIAVGCDGQVETGSNSGIIIFELKQMCLLSSNYMWLKHVLAMQYPESLLTIKGVNLWQQATVHEVNKSYTANKLLNTILYGVLAIGFTVVYWLRRKYALDDISQQQEPWYKWAAKQMLFKGTKTAIKPYHLLINYAVVLIPTLVVLIIMAFINFPELQTFKKLPLYFIWALFQQFILGYILAERVFYTKTENRLLSALLAAAVFSLLHMPSVTLVIVTFVASGLWAYAFLVFKRLLPLALSHTLLALMFYHVVSDGILYTAKVMQWFWE